MLVVMFFEGVGAHLSILNVSIPVGVRNLIIRAIVSSTKLPLNVSVFEQRHLFLMVWSQSHT
jgi:hypothetical protein